MLKFTTVVILLVGEIFKYSQSSSSVLEGAQAEDKFIRDEETREGEILEIRNKLSVIKEQLQIWPVAKSYFFGLFQKLMVVPKAMINLAKKRYYKWKKNKLKAKKEKLLQQGRRGLTLCQVAFAHYYFADKGWKLVEGDKETNSKHEVELSLSFTVDGKTKTFHRNTKHCLAKDGEKEFPVYISGVHNFGWYTNFSFFVFVKQSKLWFSTEYKLFAYVTFGNIKSFKSE